MKVASLIFIVKYLTEIKQMPLLFLELHGRHGFVVLCVIFFFPTDLFMDMQNYNDFFLCRKCKMACGSYNLACSKMDIFSVVCYESHTLGS